jgi:hypothetical protein
VSVDRSLARTPLLHVVDGCADEGRIRRAERLRRELGGHAIVMGGLDEECRCAGIGLNSIGSAPWRTIGRTVVRTCQALVHAGEMRPVPIAWSNALALELARSSSRVQLVAQGLPGAADSERFKRLDVIASDERVARAWSREGVAGTRIVEPCGLAAAAPVSTDLETPTMVILVPSQVRGARSLELYHRVGLAYLAGARITALLDPDDPEAPAITEYALKVGIEPSFRPLKRVDPRAQIALVAAEGPVSHDERILDLTARGIGVIAVVPNDLAAQTSPDPGILYASRNDANSGTKAILEMALDTKLRSKFQLAARNFGAKRDPGSWAHIMAVATAPQSRPATT